MSMNHDYDTGVALLESVKKKLCETQWWRSDDDVISGWQYNFVISETMHRSSNVSMDH